MFFCVREKEAGVVLNNKAVFVYRIILARHIAFLSNFF
jgi:hypothetical protein